MRNTYVTGYFPLIAITLFSLSFALYIEKQSSLILQKTGVYTGLLEFFNEVEIKLALLLVIFLFFFMLLSAAKLVSDTILQVALLLFSKEWEGQSLKSVRFTSIIYACGGLISLPVSFSSSALVITLFITTMFAFIYIVYHAGSYLNLSGLIGFVFFPIITWCGMIVGIGYVLLKLYNGLLASLPI